MRRLLWVVGILGVCLTGSAAEAAVITFSSAPPGPFASYTEQGVTFTASGGGGMIITQTTPNGTPGLLENNSPRKELRADIAGGATSVSVDLGDFNQDPDTIFLEIFNSANVSLGFTSLLLADSDSSMHTLSLSAPNIAYAVFGARAPAVNGSSVYADNFTFNQAATSPVPEPATVAVFGLMAAAGAGYVRRRGKAAA